MKTIRGKENPYYKRLKSLLQGKYRHRWGTYLMEGEKVVQEVLLTHRWEQIVVKEDRVQEFSFLPDSTLILERTLFDALSQTKNNQGIMAEVKKRECSREDFWKGIGKKDSLLVLDRVQDPGNVGTMIRTAEAAGYQGVLIIGGSADVYGPKVVRSAAGSLLRVPLRHVENETQAVSELRAQGKKIIVTGEKGAKNFKEIDYHGCGLVLGNEGKGISHCLWEMADASVALPMKGEIESLNVAVAAGILMYQ